MTGATMDVEALARLLANVGIDPVTLEAAVREALDDPQHGQGLDRLTGSDIRVLAKTLDVNISYFDKFYREQDNVLKGVNYVTRSFRNEANAYQNIFIRSVNVTNILLAITIVLQLVVLASVWLLAPSALASSDQGAGWRQRGVVSLHGPASPGPPEG